MGSSPICRKRAIEELAFGCESANKLQQLLLNRQDKSPGSRTAQDLVNEVMKSFANALSMFNYGRHDDDVSRIRRPSSSSSPDGSKSEPLDEISNSSRQKNSRGCYKRRKTSFTRYVDSSIWIQDGYGWRKYGQKVIHDAKYPRSYFRCTNKTDQGCEATKQVQRIREHPPLYRTTYFDEHTCKNIQQYPQIFFDDSTHEYGNAKLLSFGANNTNKQADISFFSPYSSLEQEYSEEVPSDQGSQDQSSSSIRLVSSKLPASDDHADEATLDEFLSNENLMADSSEFNFWLFMPSVEDLW